MRLRDYSMALATGAAVICILPVWRAYRASVPTAELIGEEEAFRLIEPGVFLAIGLVPPVLVIAGALIARSHRLAVMWIGIALMALSIPMFQVVFGLGPRGLLTMALAAGAAVLPIFARHREGLQP